MAPEGYAQQNIRQNSERVGEKSKGGVRESDGVNLPQGDQENQVSWTHWGLSETEPPTIKEHARSRPRLPGHMEQMRILGLLHVSYKPDSRVSLIQLHGLPWETFPLAGLPCLAPVGTDVFRADVNWCARALWKLLGVGHVCLFFSGENGSRK